MSQESALEFLKKLAKDGELKKQLADDYRRMLCELGAKNGSDFSLDDLRAAAASMKAADYGELTDASLEKVVGGLSIINATNATLPFVTNYTVTNYTG